MKKYEISTTNYKSALNFTSIHSGCAVTFKKIDFKNKEFNIIAEEIE